jgi:ABC-type bacteriocin/lantibiotic exporter with double-glycine peptidase domain
VDGKYDTACCCFPEKIERVSSNKACIQNGLAPKKVILQGNISFKNVDFTYPHTGIEALKNFTLEISKGNKIAIVGRTGSGKSNHCAITLANVRRNAKGTSNLMALSPAA